MDERDLQAEEPAARLLVDQLRTGRGEVAERGRDVVHLVRDVVHPGAAARDEAADGRVLAGRSEQLDPSGADEHGRRLDALVGHAGAVLERRSEEALVRGERVVEIGDGNTDVVDPAGSDHGGDASDRPSARSPLPASRRPAPGRAVASIAPVVAARGIHHVGVAVAELDDALATYERLFGATLEELESAGAHLIDRVPRLGLFGLEVAFVHPDSVHGVLTEVVASG